MTDYNSSDWRIVSETLKFHLDRLETKRSAIDGNVSDVVSGMKRLLEYVSLEYEYRRYLATGNELDGFSIELSSDIFDHPLYNITSTVDGRITKRVDVDLDEEEDDIYEHPFFEGDYSGISDNEDYFHFKKCAQTLLKGEWDDVDLKNKIDDSEGIIVNIKHEGRLYIFEIDGEDLGTDSMLEIRNLSLVVEDESGMQHNIGEWDSNYDSGMMSEAIANSDSYKFFMDIPPSFTLSDINEIDIDSDAILNMAAGELPPEDWQKIILKSAFTQSSVDAYYCAALDNAQLNKKLQNILLSKFDSADKYETDRILTGLSSVDINSVNPDPEIAFTEGQRLGEALKWLGVPLDNPEVMECFLKKLSGNTITLRTTQNMLKFVEGALLPLLDYDSPAVSHFRQKIMSTDGSSIPDWSGQHYTKSDTKRNIEMIASVTECLVDATRINKIISKNGMADSIANLAISTLVEFTGSDLTSEIKENGSQIPLEVSKADLKDVDSTKHSEDELNYDWICRKIESLQGQLSITSIHDFEFDEDCDSSDAQFTLSSNEYEFTFNASFDIDYFDDEYFARFKKIEIDVRRNGEFLMSSEVWDDLDSDNNRWPELADWLGDKAVYVSEGHFKKERNADLYDQVINSNTGYSAIYSEVLRNCKNDYNLAGITTNARFQEVITSLATTPEKWLKDLCKATTGKHFTQPSNCVSTIRLMAQAGMKVDSLTDKHNPVSVMLERHIGDKSYNYFCEIAGLCHDFGLPEKEVLKHPAITSNDKLSQAYQAYLLARRANMIIQKIDGLQAEPANESAPPIAVKRLGL